MNPVIIPEPKTGELKGIEKRILCARICEGVKRFYENPENVRQFEEWQAKRQASAKQQKKTFI